MIIHLGDEGSHGSAEPLEGRMIDIHVGDVLGCVGRGYLLDDYLGQTEAAYRFVNSVINIVKHAHAGTKVQLELVDGTGKTMMIDVARKRFLMRPTT